MELLILFSFWHFFLLLVCTDTINLKYWTHILQPCQIHLFVFLSLKCVSCRQHIIVSCIFIYFDDLSLLNTEAVLLIFNVITDVVRFEDHHFIISEKAMAPHSSTFA